MTTKPRTRETAEMKKAPTPLFAPFAGVDNLPPLDERAGGKISERSFFVPGKIFRRENNSRGLR